MIKRRFLLVTAALGLSLLTVLAKASDFRLVPDQSTVDVPLAAITRAWPDYFYVENEQRTFGIRVLKSGHGLSEGSLVAVHGTIGTSDAGERQVLATSAPGSDSGSVNPLLVLSRSLGGDNWCYDPVSGRGLKGVANGFGLNNVGMLVKAVGRVTYVDPNEQFLDIWDGSYTPTGAPTDPSGGVGIRVVVPPMPLPKTGAEVAVVGVLSVYSQGTASYPFVLTNSVADLTLLAYNGTPDNPDSSFADTNGDGIDGDITRAIFVAKTWGNDSNPGTFSRPVATIERGIALAASASPKKDVYVSTGEYRPASGTVTMVSGVSIYGGYDASPRWHRSVAYPTVIRGVTTAIRANSIAEETHVEGFGITTENATAAGGSTYAIYVSGGTGSVVIRSNSILAGNGCQGVAGVSGAKGAGGGSGGNGGSGACDSGPAGAGGAGGSSACGRTGGAGGAGGAAGQYNGVTGSSGAGGTLGGVGGNCGDPGMAGHSGALGAAGGAGTNGTAASPYTIAISNGLFVPAPGGDGTAGINGNGGGGGGGGGGQYGMFVVSGAGNGGGGGGGGAAGGAKGTGGQGGGGSFGVFIVNAAATVEGNTITSGSGGTGGAGGSGGTGGTGGAGGSGGSQCTSEVGAGGQGGKGGNGGRGGHGAGGCGGPSICVYTKSSPTAVIGNNQYTVASPAPGGPSLGDAGMSGMTATVYRD